MKLLAVASLCLMSLLAGPAGAAPIAWTQGTHYTLAETVNRETPTPGKALVTEVFSYACPACNAFAPTMRKLRAAMPKAEFRFVPAGFIPAEDWPVFQRAYCTALVLGVADKAHDEVFKAVWTTGELATTEPGTQRLKQVMPTIEDLAKFYNRQTGVKVADFVATAASFSVDQKVKAADEYVRNYRVTSTPTIIVNGKYVTDVRSAGGYDQLIELVQYLAAKG